MFRAFYSLKNTPSVISKVLSVTRRSLNASASTNLTQISVGQEGTAYVDLKGVKNAKLQIATAWQDHCNIQIPHSIVPVIAVTDEGDVFSLTAEENSEIEHEFKIIIPEYFNCVVYGDNMTCNVSNKLMGNLSIECNSGDISVEKVRGEVIVLKCPRGDVTISKVVEGNVTISSRNLLAQMINGNKVDITCGDSAAVAAVYSSSTSIQAEVGMKVDLSHGHIHTISRGNISLSNVDGSFDAHSSAGDVIVQVNKLYPKSSNTAQALMGSVTALLDPEMGLNVQCNRLVLSTSPEEPHHSLLTSDATTTPPSSSRIPPHGSRHDRNIIVDSDSFEGFIRDDIECSGHFTGQSSALKRPEFSRKHANKSGKIDLAGAEELSLRRGRNTDDTSPKSSHLGHFSTTPTSVTQPDDALPGSTGGGRKRVMSRRQIMAAEEFEEAIGRKNKPSTPEMRATLNIKAKEIIKLETISWIGRIKRNHGFH